MRIATFARETLRRRGVATCASSRVSRRIRSEDDCAGDKIMSDLLWLGLIALLVAATLGYARLCDGA
jgi:hypothetical protein